MIDQAVLLCAGKGTRLGNITSNTPKPLVPVMERPFLFWLLDDLVEAGVKDIILLVGYLGPQFKYITELYPRVRLVESNVVVNKGVLGIRGLNSRFLVANGDCYPIFYREEPLEALLEDSRRPSLGVKETSEGSVKDCGLAIVDKDVVSMGLLNCGNFSSMRGILGDFYLEGNLHINDLDGLKGAETWLSGKTSIVTSRQLSPVNS